MSDEDDIVGDDPIEMVEYIIPNPASFADKGFSDEFEGAADNIPVKSVHGSENEEWAEK